jgi:prepilin-type N-terminal cleavage/methylation domain-containing protein
MKDITAMITQKSTVLSALPGRTSRRKGFTLTEIAIVMGIIGIVLAAIWTISATVMANNKVTIALQETTFIVEGYRGLYNLRGIPAAAATDVTCAGVIDGFFPPAMGSSAASCVTGTTASYPQDPWTDPIMIMTIPSEQAIDFEYIGISPAACIRIATQTPDSSSIFAVSLPDGTSISAPALPITPDVANPHCTAGGVLQILYKAR